MKKRENKKVLLTEMTWPEVEEALRETDVVIIPVGSCEQHGLHLPLGTDMIQALERCKKIAVRARALVAPVLYVGYSEHHMHFPGTITLSPETLVQVLFEACESLSKHGFKRILLFNNHGGNEEAINFAAQMANRKLHANVISFGAPEIMKFRSPKYRQNLDIHAGFDETANMLRMKPELVHLDKARAPKITLPPNLERARQKFKDDPNLFGLINKLRPAIHQITDTGSVTLLGNPAEAKDTLPESREIEEKILSAAVTLIQEWASMKTVTTK
jgi:creatinine amidohydrolase